MGDEPKTLTLEERVAALEKEVADLRIQLNLQTNRVGNWVDRISGSMKDIPEEAWQEFQGYCQEIRNADRPPDNTP